MRKKPGPCRNEPDAEESLEELASLAATAGATVVQSVIQTRQAADPATLIGSGKLQEIRGMVEGLEIDTVIFDHDLTPTQQRNLERALDIKVLDRTQLILDIFASRARTREGHLQVELAQMNYLLPRLAGRGTQMSRLGGGIGTRGPGETQLETDRRKIYRKIRRIEEELEAVKAGRAIQRRQRVEVPLSTLALVGYTNAGKSTLFNRLTGAGVEADARLFATLDPTVRKLQLPSRRQVLVSDTVGFIRNLPTMLVKAFRATLEEVRQAAVLLHVIDISSPLAGEHTEQVLEVLRALESDASPRVLVLNKVDLLPEGVEAETAAARLLGEGAEAVKTRAAAISAQSGEGIPRLLELIDEILAGEKTSMVRFRIPAADGAAINLVHERAQVHEVVYKEEYCLMTAYAPESLRRRLREFVVE